MARGWGVGTPASGIARPIVRGRPDRLGAGVFRLGERPGQKGGNKVGKNPTDKAKAGTKRHVVVDGKGIPLSVMTSGANVHDSMVFEELLDSITPIKRPGRGRPRKRPEKLHADKAYDDKKCARVLKKRGIKRRIARKGVESSQKLGRHRWVVERTFSWLGQNRRMSKDYERLCASAEALVYAAMIRLMVRRLARA